MNEQEEFEFRLRLEKERATVKPVTVPEVKPSFIKDLGLSARAAVGSMVDGVASFRQGARNVVGGGVRGAGSFGATMARPFETGAENTDRRNRIDTDMAELVGADPESLLYGGSKLAAEVLGTLGVGGGLVKGLSAIPAVANSAKAAPLLEAIATAGFKAGGAGLGTRTAGGAITGAASAGAVNQNDAVTGGVIGSVFPGAVKVAGSAGSGIRSFLRPGNVRAAEKIAATVDKTPAALISALEQSGPQMIPGYRQTVPQILQMPEISQLQRTLKTAGFNAIGEAETLQQKQLLEALNRVAPVDLTVNDAANRAGTAIENFAIPKRAQDGRDVTKAFEGIDPFNESGILLPLDEMKAIQAEFRGPGSFVSGGKAQSAIDAAEKAGTFKQRAPADTLFQAVRSRGGVRTGWHAKPVDWQTVQTLRHAKPVDWQTVQTLRGDLNESIKSLTKEGATKESTALQGMVAAIDDKLKALSSGQAGPGEYFPKDMVDQYRQALAMHRDKKLTFNTGPQAGMFRRGADGLPQIQGGEIPGKFFSGNQSQAADIESFNRLIKTNPGLADELRRFATTQAASTSNQAGNLTTKYTDWLASRSGAIKGLFDDSDQAILSEIGKAVQRQNAAENTGRVTGSDTAQKMKSLMDMGLLSNPLMGAAATRLPFGERGVSFARETVSNSRNKTLADLLANPDALIKALQFTSQASTPSKSLPFVMRSAPVIGAAASD